MSQASRSIFTRYKPVQVLLFGGLAILIFIILAIVMASVIPEGMGIDWRVTYRPAALAFLHGQSPYGPNVAPGAPFFPAPWSLLPLLPFALLPVGIGRAVVMLTGLLVFAYTAWRLGARPVVLAFFLVSPPVLHCIINANIDWLPLFVLPPSIGLFFVTAKPQVGFAVAVFWLIESWRKGGWRQTLRTFAPVTIVFLGSLWLYGLWPLNMRTALAMSAPVNSSLWPISIPIGLTLLVTAIQKRQIRFAMPASPCLSPYVLFHAWSSALIALVSQPLQLITVVIGLWIVVIMRLI